MAHTRQFTAFSRVLHWTMAVLVLAMLFIGVGMMGSLADYHLLVAIHRPLGIAVFLLVVVRFINRLLNPPPPFPATMSRLERVAATTSERMMYALMFLLPLVGWGMLSAARNPIVLVGPVRLPFILPPDPALYAMLRKTHAWLAYLLFLTILSHLGAILYHTLIVRDGILMRMAPWNIRPAGQKLAQAANDLPTPAVNVAGSDDRTPDFASENVEIAASYGLARNVLSAKGPSVPANTEARASRLSRK